MDAFENLFWNLDQVTFWVWSRCPQWVRSVPKDVLFLDIVVPDPDMRKNEIDERLWHASGWDRKQANEARLVLPESPEMQSLNRAIFYTRKPQLILGCLFPITDYLLFLLRSGRLTATGNLPGELLARLIFPIDWASLEIRACFDNRNQSFHRGVFRSGHTRHYQIAKGLGQIENVRISRAEVLKAFPEIHKDAVNIEAMFRAAANRSGGNLTQRRAEEIARESGININRTEIRKSLKDVVGHSKPGPKGPRKNCAD